MYNPDGWVLIKITGDEPHYRIFGSWRGSYTEGESWRMNSGVIKVREDDDFYYFKGYSGSEYKCRKDGYGNLGLYSETVVSDYEKNSADMLKIIKNMPDIMNMDWIIR